MIDLRLGRWQDVLQDVDEFDCLMVDAPYSERTHEGNNAGDRREGELRPIDFRAWDTADIAHLVGWATERCRGWCVSITDDESLPTWRRAFDRAGWATFASVPSITPGRGVRLAGDGPSSVAEHICVARPRTREMATWGALPGYYVTPRGLPAAERARPHPGGKTLWVMRQLVMHYTRQGDLIVDPCAGGGTTLLAAALMGRRSIGAEVDEDAYRAAERRLADGWTPPLRGMEGAL